MPVLETMSGDTSWDGFGPRPRQWNQVAAGGAPSYGPPGRDRNVQQQEAWVRKNEFKRNMEMEKARRNGGKKEKNYLLFMNTDNDKFYKLPVIADMLEKSGIGWDDVIAFNRDPEKPTTTEVLLKQDKEVNIEEIKKVLVDNKFKFDVDSFGYSIEVLHVRRLGLTSDPWAMAGIIKETISPYVEKVVDVTPMKWSLNKDLSKEKHYKAFNGKYDGNYRVRVVPTEGRVIPGYIPIGTEDVRAEVQYSMDNKRNILCSVCFSDEHLRGHTDCKGGEGWKAYSQKFKIQSQRILEGEDFVMPPTEMEKIKEELQKKKEELVENQELFKRYEQEKEDNISEKENLVQRKTEIEEKLKETERELEEKRKEMDDNITHLFTENEQKVAEVKRRESEWEKKAKEAQTLLDLKSQELEEKTHLLEKARKENFETKQSLEKENVVAEPIKENTVETDGAEGGMDVENQEEKTVLNEEEEAEEIETVVSDSDGGEIEEGEGDNEKERGEKTKKRRKGGRSNDCGECDPCQIEDNCLECINCKKPKRKQKCEIRQCLEVQKKKKMKTKKKKENKEKVQPEEQKDEEDLRLYLSQTQDSVSLLASVQDDRALNVDSNLDEEDISFEDDSNFEDDGDFPDGQVMTDEQVTTEDGSPESTLRGTASTISMELDSIGGASRRESFTGGDDGHEGLEEEVSPVLDWDQANDVWNEEENFSSLEHTEFDPGVAQLSPLKQAFKNKFNQVRSGVSSQVKSMVLNLEQRKENDKKAEAAKEKEKRMEETKAARDKSIQESKSDFVRRMSESGKSESGK